MYPTLERITTDWLRAGWTVALTPATGAYGCLRVRVSVRRPDLRYPLSSTIWAMGSGEEIAAHLARLYSTRLVTSTL